MESILYFAYGSNMLEQRLRKRCKSARVVGTASAAGYGIAFSKISKDGSGKATLVANAAPEVRVYGVVFKINRDELPKLDNAEGVGSGYDPKDDFLVELGPDKNPTPVLTYIANPDYIDPSRGPYDWYLDLVIKGAEEHGLPAAYISALVATPFLPDADLNNPERIKALTLLSRLKQKGACMKTRANVRIAGKRTVGEWGVMRSKLVGEADTSLWKTAYEKFFVQRLRTRYFAPVKNLQRSKRLRGEGFSIVAIQCSLIEFLGATLSGKTYVLRSEFKDPKLQYHRSGEMFVEFLEGAVPFVNEFKGVADDFYTGVRCGLLHEARTKKHWLIRADHDSGRIIDVTDPTAKIVYRNNLQTAFDTFVEWYRTALQTDKALQDAFIRKFDSLCLD